MTNKDDDQLTKPLPRSLRDAARRLEETGFRDEAAIRNLVNEIWDLRKPRKKGPTERE